MLTACLVTPALLTVYAVAIAVWSEEENAVYSVALSVLKKEVRTAHPVAPKVLDKEEKTGLSIDPFLTTYLVYLVPYLV